MHGGIELGRIAGVDVTADWSVPITFVLIAIYLATGALPAWHPQWTPAMSWTVALGAAVLFVGSVLLRELVHALAARRAGAPVGAVTLFPFGGIPFMGLEFGAPAAERRIAMAGSVTSVLVAMLCFALAADGASAGATVLQIVGWMNVALCAFNLLPAYPLDGGRALRAFIWSVSGDHRLAARLACRAGQAFGWAMILFGVAQCLGMSVPVLDDDSGAGPWLILIGWFLNRAALASHRSLLIVDVYRRLATLDVLSDVSVTKLMRDVPLRLHPMDEVRELHDRLPLRAKQPLLPIEKNGLFLGWVRHEDLAGLEFAMLGTLRIAELMIPVTYLPTVHPEQTVAEAVLMMNRCCIEDVPVVWQERLLGIVSREDVVTWMCQEVQGIDIDRTKSKRVGG